MRPGCRYGILIDFGSTYTKMVLADMKSGELIHSCHYLSTVSTDATIALKKCLGVAEKYIGAYETKHALKLASSSAAGGLRMGVCGLSASISLQAGKIAAFGAGGKILGSAAGKLKKTDTDALDGLPLEIILFTGGYENGSTAALLHNARMLSMSEKNIPVIYAGNSKISSEIRSIFLSRGKECYLAQNIIPQIGELNKADVEIIIRDLFMKRIVNMKGLSEVSKYLDEIVMPTPKAVLSAGELLCKGTAKQEGWGELMIVDIGGATTDVHSYADSISHQGAKIVGTPEPFSKRTVEGDLGLNESKESLIKEAGLPADGITDEELACHAAAISARRHAGRLVRTVSAGEKLIQYGKDLSAVKTVIGTGGPIVYNPRAREVLLSVTADEREAEVLLPQEVCTMLDREYVLFAAGLLREVDEEIAMSLMKQSITEV